MRQAGQGQRQFYDHRPQPSDPISSNSASRADLLRLPRGDGSCLIVGVRPRWQAVRRVQGLRGSGTVLHEELGFIAVAAAGRLHAACGCGTVWHQCRDAAAADEFSISHAPPRGRNFTGTLPFLNRDMRLPAGSWKVAATQAIVAKNVGLAGAFVALTKIQGTSLQNVLILFGNARPAPNGFPANKLCQTSDVIWNDVAQNLPQGDQDCAVINFERPVLWRSGNKNAAAGIMSQLDLLNVQPPNIMVSVSVHEANRNWVLDEFLAANPDLAGIAPDMSTQRAQSSWVGFRAASDPAKQKFIDDLKALATPMRATLRSQIQAPAPYLPGTGLTPE